MNEIFKLDHQQFKTLVGIEHQLEKIMSALNDLTLAQTAETAAITDLTVALAAAIPDINPLPGSGLTEAQGAAAAVIAQTNAKNIAAQTALISASLTAPATAVPGAPTGLTAATSAGSTVTLTFNASPGATSYNVLRSLTTGGPYAVAATVTGTPKVNTFSEGGLPVGIQVFYVVNAMNAIGTSANSAEVSATPTA